MVRVACAFEKSYLAVIIKEIVQSVFCFQMEYLIVTEQNITIVCSGKPDHLSSKLRRSQMFEGTRCLGLDELVHEQR